jgi:hypothetical protein
MALDHTYLTWFTYSNISHSRQQMWTDPLPLRRRTPDNPQHVGWPIRRSVLSFSPTTANEAVGKSQTSIDNRLLGLPGPYHCHAIGTFNTCLRGPTHRSLIDTDGGYNLGDAGLPHTTHRPSQPAVSPFHLSVSPGLQVNHSISTVTNWT